MMPNKSAGPGKQWRMRSRVPWRVPWWTRVDFDDCIWCARRGLQRMVSRKLYWFRMCAKCFNSLMSCGYFTSISSWYCPGKPELMNAGLAYCHVKFHPLSNHFLKLVRQARKVSPNNSLRPIRTRMWRRLPNNGILLSWSFRWVIE